MKSTVVDESLSSFKPMYCSREYQASTRLSQQYEKSTPNSKAHLDLTLHFYFLGLFLDKVDISVSLLSDKLIDIQ